jgi:hypothetical protein
VLSRGMAECLQVPAENPSVSEGTADRSTRPPHASAVELYNQLAKEKPVGGLFNMTC